MKHLILVTGVLTMSLGLAIAQEPPSADGERGKALYVQTGCYACHGLAGQGAQATGPRLLRTTLPFGAFLVFLRAPVNKMPPYEPPVLTNDEAADIYAYLKRLPLPRDARDIAALEAVRK